MQQGCEEESNRGGEGVRIKSPFQRTNDCETPTKAFANDKILQHRLMETKYQFNMGNPEQIEFSSSKALQILWTKIGWGRESLT